MSYLYHNEYLAINNDQHFDYYKGSRRMHTDILKKRVAVVDDDSDFQAIAGLHLKRFGFEVTRIETIDLLNDLLDAYPPSIILLDWQFGAVDGTTLIRSLRECHPGASVVFATAHATPEVAALSIKLGAFDFITKPIDESRFQLTITRAQEHSNLLNRILEAQGSYDDSEFEGIVARSPQMKAVFSAIHNVAQTDASVMISGESGVGKELVANAIHLQGARINRPFVPINMASIPETLVESHLFGHEKGAFTGADRQLTGSVREAHSGTLFLDEITEMPILLQAKLLRFLQEGTFRPLGSDKDLESDARIISATNRNPGASVKDGALRQDLFYRLNVIPIEVPPLRERDGDIALLALHFLKEFSREHEKDFISIEPSALELLEQYSWPGNVRELSHIIQRIVIMNSGNTVSSDHIPAEIVHHSAKNSPDNLPDENMTHSPGEVIASEHPRPVAGNVVPLAELEREAIKSAMKLCGGIAYEAADALGISRATIYRKIKLYNIRQNELSDPPEK